MTGRKGFHADFRQMQAHIANLSSGFDGYLNGIITPNQLQKAWAATLPQRDIVVITVPINGNANNNIAYVMDFRFRPVRWSYWTMTAMACVASVIDPGDANRRTLMAGGYDGFVRKLMRVDRNVDTTGSISSRAVTPFFNYGSPMIMKTLAKAGVGIAAKNSTTSKTAATTTPGFLKKKRRAWLKESAN